jgi:putative aldouronate transport system permease protein
MKDTIFALIVPYLVIPWFVLLFKGFLSNIPMSLIEYAKIDGASEYRIFFRIVLPMSKPGLATIGLFYLLHYWNDYYLSLLFIQNSKNVSLQFLLYRIMSNIDFLNSALAVNSGMVRNVEMPNQSARMAMCVLAAGPMLFIFPFFQRYFIKGITVGAIKE